MSNIAEIDKNFKIETQIEKDDIKFYDVREEPFKVYGVIYENGFRRMPQSVAESVSTGVNWLHAMGAGGRVRFKTNSPYIVINAKLSHVSKMSHFAFTGSIGFDMYIDERKEGKGLRHYSTFIPPQNIENHYEGIAECGGGEMKEWVIHLPLYTAVDELYIGLSETAKIEPGTPYRIEKPVVYYGSSITQGGCASRPGNCYQNIVSRRLDINHINLGFSGNAKGEDNMTDYIKNLEMAAFVLDYDYNSPTIETLKETHEKMFKSIRAANPELPILIMEKPKYYLTPSELKRCDVVRATYDNAIKNGDKNVYYLDHKKLTEISGNDGNVDYAHPNDLGFYSMAKAVGDVLCEIFK